MFNQSYLNRGVLQTPKTYLTLIVQNKVFDCVDLV